MGDVSVLGLQLARKHHTVGTSEASLLPLLDLELDQSVCKLVLFSNHHSTTSKCVS